jgi:diguanylate cyclase (GGDEF)-like protein
MSKQNNQEKKPLYSARRVPFRRLPPDAFWQVIMAMYFIPPLLERFFLVPGFFLSERMAIYAFWLLPLIILCYYLGLKGGIIAAVGVAPFFLWQLRALLVSGNEFYSVLTVYFGLFIAFAILAGLLAEKIIRFAEVLISVAVTDEQTGLYDPRFFLQCLEREVDRARRYQTPLSVVLVGFLQHSNFAVTTIARLIQDTVRVSDTVARFDAGEFAIILPQTTAVNAKLFCERFRQALESAAVIDQQDSDPLIPFFGIVEYERPQSGQQMIDEANRKLYYAKSQWKNLDEQQ